MSNKIPTVLTRRQIQNRITKAIRAVKLNNVYESRLIAELMTEELNNQEIYIIHDPLPF